MALSSNDQVCKEQENWVHIEENTQPVKSDPKLTRRRHREEDIEVVTAATVHVSGESNRDTEDIKKT